MMRKVMYLLIVLALTSCGNDTSSLISTEGVPVKGLPSVKKVSISSVLSNMEKGSFRKGELLVKFRSGILSSSSARTHQAVGARLIKKFDIVPDLEQVRLPEGLSVADAIKQYMNDPDVEYAVPNHLRHAMITPDDPLFRQQWGMAKIKAPAAWDITRGSGNVIVAVPDTGIDSTHPDLGANIIQGFNFITGTTDAADDYGHGTHVSGIIGAVGDNSAGVAGLMWNVQIMPLKILDSDGNGTIAAEIQAIDFAIAHGARVISASFAGGASNPAEMDAITRANNAGVLLVAAAGNGGGALCDTLPANNNDGVQKCYPASYDLPNIISVAATDQGDNLANFSNFGPGSVHVAGPGVNVLSTIPFNLPPCTNHPFASNYDYCSGTSQATPHVSGLAGLLFSAYPNLTYSQVRGMIIKYVDVLPSLQNKVYSNGRINAFKAVSALSAPTNLSASASSSGASVTWSDNATGEDGYRVERRTGGGSFSQISTVGADVASFTDSGISDGTSYTYRVRAFSSVPNPPGSTIEADSVYSNETAVSIPLSPPSGLTATAVTSDSVTLTWTNNSQAAAGIRLQRQSPGGNFADIGTVGANVNSFSDTGLSPATTYSYRVAAFNSSAGNSTFSNTVTVTTSSPGPPPPSGGGGGCTIGGRQNTPSSIADLVVILAPIIILSALRYRRRLNRKRRSM